MGKTKHNLCKTRLYGIWKSIRKRCYCTTTRGYKYWGGRGIKLCDEWKDDFLSFYNWAINNKYNDSLTIDRINNSGNYEPSNCRWVTQSTQNKNRSSCNFYTFNNESHLLTEWEKILNIPYSCLRGRIKKGWSIEKAFTTPSRNRVNREE